MTEPVDAADATDLAAFLRSRRARVDPASAGVPTGTRRRVAGLRREEVAHLSGVSVDYYVRLEQGRARQPSEQVLIALARVLRLDDIERGHLIRLARHPDPHTAGTAAPTTRVRPELRRTLSLLSDVPALITDHRGDVLAANALARLLYRDPPMPFNLARHIFLEESARDMYVDWEACTVDSVGNLRLAAGKYPKDAGLAALIGELAMRSERFRRLWARADVRCRTHGRKVLFHPEVGRLELDHESFVTADGSGQELIVYSAAEGSEGETALRLLGAVAATVEVERTAVRPGP